MRACLLASGSKGNALFIEAGDTRILVDAGLAAAELVRRLSLIGVDASDLDAVLITHEHTDHVRGAGTLSRRLNIPALVSYQTHRETGSSFRKAQVIEFESGYSFAYRDIMIDPFPITHDAADPVGFVIESREGRVGIATDLGIPTRLVGEKLKGCRLLVLESNHDEEMLLNGPYPWHLKQRIKSRHGHLSNRESAALLDEIMHDGLEGVFLAHLSEVNNDPAVALEVTKETIEKGNVCSPALFVGNQYLASGVFSA